MMTREALHQKFEQEHNVKWNCLGNVPSPEYVKWLEDKVIDHNKKKVP